MEGREGRREGGSGISENHSNAPTRAQVGGVDLVHDSTDCRSETAGGCEHLAGRLHQQKQYQNHKNHNNHDNNNSTSTNTTTTTENKTSTSHLRNCQRV